MDEAYYAEFLENNPDYVNDLQGFVHYDDTLACGARTLMGLPALLTGIPDTMPGSYTGYKSKVWGGKNALNVLNDAGYNVCFYTEVQPVSSECIAYLDNFTDGGVAIGSRSTFVKRLLQIDLYKFVPHYLKRFFWMDAASFDDAAESTGLYLYDNPSFFADYRASGFIVGSQEKTARVYHMRGAHKAYRNAADGSLDTNATLQDAVAGCFNVIGEMLTELKDKGLYDDATIIITADHGDLDEGQHCILLLKEAGDTEPYHTNHAPASLFDVSGYIAGLVGETLEGRTYAKDLLSLKEGEERERFFFRNSSDSSRLAVRAYATTEYAGDYDALHEVEAYIDTEGVKTPYTLGTELLFTIEETANRYCTEGFGHNSGWDTDLFGPYSEMQIPIENLPEDGTLRAHIELWERNTMKDLEFEIYANGNKVLESKSTPEVIASGIDVEIPVSSFDDSGVLTLGFEIPSISNKELDIEDVESRTRTLSFVSIVVDVAK